MKYSSDENSINEQLEILTRGTNVTQSLDVLVERVENLKGSLEEKHGQNRRDIHAMRNDMQTLAHEVWLIKIKITAYATGAGILTAIALKALDHIWK